MRAALFLIAIPAFAAAASAPVPPPNPLGAELSRAQAEQAAAEAQAMRLERAAASARSQADKLRAEQAAAAQQIAAAEARITAADARLRLISTYLRTRRERLDQAQQPLSALLAGLAVMAERPPLLTLADRGGTDELVKVRVLLASTLPVIRSRTAALSAEMRAGEQAARAATQAQADLAKGRENLLARRQQFAALERRALQVAAVSGGQALGAGDTALSAAESVDRARSALATSRASASLASALAAGTPAPARPVAPEDAARSMRFDYQLPANVPVTDGLGAVSASGIRSRGITLATGRGAAVAAPASGIVRFAGPYRDFDGVIIIEHAGGWTSVLVNASTQLLPGARVERGQAIGQALGPLFVELLQNGTRRSPALIAGSSPALSKDSKGS